MGAQNWNHISKMSRFWVTGQIGVSKKGLNSWKNIFGASEWYQSIGLIVLTPQSKNTDMVIVFNMSQCGISVKQNLKKFHLTDFIKGIRD